MSKDLNISQEFTLGAARIRALSGTLDHDFDASFFASPGHPHLILDMSGVAAVASVGVRQWTQCLARAAPTLQSLYFVSIAPRVTDQFNMIVGFSGPGEALSFQGTYHCEHCDHDCVVVLDALCDRESIQAKSPPKRQCAVCGLLAELDEVPEIFFEHFSSNAVPMVNEAAAAILAAEQSWISPPPGQRFGARQTNDGTVRLSGVLDETFDAAYVASLLKPHGAIDIGKIRHITLRGTETWLELLERTKDVPGLRLLRCAPPFIRRASEDAAILGNLRVETLSLPRANKSREVVDSIDVAIINGTPDQKAASRSGTAADLIMAFTRSMEQAQSGDALSLGLAAMDDEELDSELESEWTTEAHFPQVLDNEGKRFEFLAHVSSGGMADIFLARQHGHLGFRRLVIVKRIRDEFLVDDRMIRLFLDEARLAARLDHPNVIRVHDLGLSDGSYYMVVDFVHGVSMAEILKRMVRRKITMPVELALEIVRQLCLALEAAHVPGPDGKMLLHRDVTPSNVLVRMDGIVKLIDFGLAGWREFQRDRLRSGTVVGSIPYVPPEIILGHNLTPAVDLWGTGLLLLVLLTARHPFQRDSSAATMRAIVHEPLKISATVDKVAIPVIKAALERDPAKRVQTASDLRTLVEEALNQLAIARLKTTGFFIKKREMTPPPDMSKFLRELFDDRVQREKNFIKKLGRSTLTDALLDGEPKYVEQFFGSDNPNDFIHATHRTETYE